MQRLAGIDVNGWHDWAARNWQADDPDQQAETPQFVDGGISAVVVRDADDRLIAGPQAILSPHGRGGGWGKIGDPDRRTSVRQVLADLPAAGDALAAIDGALVAQAMRLVFTIPDIADMDARAQQALLDRLGGRRRPQIMLLWRSVAAVLGALRIGAIGTGDADRMIGIVVHTSDGFEVQSLRLRALEEHHGILAPEREDAGATVVSGWGLASLLGRLHAMVSNENPQLRDGSIEASRLAERLLLGDETGELVEILRRDSGTWLKATAPDALRDAVATPSLPENLAAGLDGVSVVLLSTPLTEHLASRLEMQMRDLTSSRVVRLEGHALASGALEAAQRIKRGIPHYLDRLDPVAMAVLRGAEAVFAPLFPPEAVVPANREFVSEPMPAQWRKGVGNLEFFIKRGSEGIRKWITKPHTPPERTEQVYIQLFQTPAKGLARVEIRSHEWEELRRAPIRLDWDHLSVEERSEAEILKSLSRPLPGKPERLVYEAHLDLWEGSKQVGEGLSRLLAKFDAGNQADLDALHGLLHRSYNPFDQDKPFGQKQKFFALSTDGEPPEGVSATEALDAVIHDLVEELLADVSRGRLTVTSKHFLCAAWTFTRCPVALQDEMLEALGNKDHPLNGFGSARHILLHGIGRTASTQDRIRRALELSLALPQNAWTRACQSFLLSRRPLAPHALDDKLVAQLAQCTVDALNDQLTSRNFKQDFAYTLYVITGLLRYREVQPHAIMADRPGAARVLSDLLKRILTRLTHPSFTVQAKTTKIQVVQELIKYLAGEQGDPRLLYVIDEIS